MSGKEQPTGRNRVAQTIATAAAAEIAQRCGSPCEVKSIESISKSFVSLRPKQADTRARLSIQTQFRI